MKVKVALFGSDLHDTSLTKHLFYVKNYALLGGLRNVVMGSARWRAALLYKAPQKWESRSEYHNRGSGISRQRNASDLAHAWIPLYVSNVNGGMFTVKECSRGAWPMRTPCIRWIVYGSQGSQFHSARPSESPSFGFLVRELPNKYITKCTHTAKKKRHAPRHFKWSGTLRFSLCLICFVAPEVCFGVERLSWTELPSGGSGS